MSNEEIKEFEALRSIAVSHNELAFAQLCTAALQGEQWAFDEVDHALDRICSGKDGLGEPTTSWMLKVIREADTTRPDSAIARNLESP